VFLVEENHYNTINSNSFASELVRININSHHRLLTLDIKDLCLNIPIQEILNFTKFQLNAHNDKKKNTHQNITMLNTILRQSYFSFLGQIYQPEKGVVMASPIKGKMAESFLQQLEISIFKHLIDAKILSFYTRSVDNILFIYDSTRTNRNGILQYFDIIHSNIQLSSTVESANNINFLDLFITRG